MSGDDDGVYVHGQIDVAPAVPAGVVAAGPFSAARADGREVFLLPDGAGRGVAVVAADPHGGSAGLEPLTAAVDELVRWLGPGGHTFSGALYARGPDAGDVGRVRVVDGSARLEHAQIVFLEDFAPPAGPVVRFDPAAAVDWLVQPVPSRVCVQFCRRAEHYGVPWNGTYDATSDRPGDWLYRLLPDLSGNMAPAVWHTAAGIAVEVVETVDVEGVADGGVVLVVEVGGLRLASPRLAPLDLVAYSYGDPPKPRVDAVVESLNVAAQSVTDLVGRYRVMCLAVRRGHSAGSPVR